MEFDSPDAAKEFPGLYLADSGKVDDSLECKKIRSIKHQFHCNFTSSWEYHARLCICVVDGEDGDKKKSKKEKKKDKDKGYSALAPDSDEENPLDPKYVVVKI